MAGRTPVMINYSTGAKKNCRYAQHQCDFHTIITTRALLEKTGCPQLPEMLFIEDILASLSPIEKGLAFAKTLLPTPLLKRLVGRNDLDQPAVILFTAAARKTLRLYSLHSATCYPISIRSVSIWKSMAWTGCLQCCLTSMSSASPSTCGRLCVWV